MPDEDLQLTLHGEEVPLDKVPKCSCPEAGQDPLCAIHGSFAGIPPSQIGPDDLWPEDFL